MSVSDDHVLANSPLCPVELECVEPLAPKPCCYDCLSEDVAVKVIDMFGFEH